jgi:hypothetical protein
MKIKSVCIVGGGSSGWMTAAALTKLCPWLDVTLVESKLPTVGVGESTLGHINYFLRLLDLKDEDWMPQCNATYKNSIRFTNFAKKDGSSFEYPFVDGYDMSYAPNGLDTWSELHAKFKDEFPNTTFAEFYALSNTLLAKHNRETNEDLPGYNFTYDTAYHMDAGLFGEYLKNEICIPGGVTLVEGTVHSHTKDRLNRIEQLLCTNGRKVYADLFIDCTGFRSLLLEGMMGSEFLPFKDYLQNDAAWAVRIPYTDRKNQMENVTDCTAIENGWVWNIALWNRIGTGYCFSRRFVTSEDALVEFKNHLKEGYPEVDTEELKPFFIDIKHGKRRWAWKHNVVGIGLSYAFVEPLESTGLLSTHENILKLVDILNRRNGTVTNIERHSFNFACQTQIDGFRNFVALHYALSSRTDTPYWQYVSQVHEYAPELLGPYQIASFENVDALNGPITYGTMKPDMQGANFIMAGMDIAGCNTAKMIDELKLRNGAPNEDAEIIATKDFYLKQKQFLEEKILKMPTHYEYLRDNIYGGKDEYDT